MDSITISGLFSMLFMYALLASRKEVIFDNVWWSWNDLHGVRESSRSNSLWNDLYWNKNSLLIMEEGDVLRNDVQYVLNYGTHM